MRDWRALGFLNSKSSVYIRKRIAIIIMRLETQSLTVPTATPLKQPSYFVPFPFLRYTDFYMVLMMARILSFSSIFR